ncbi:efflux transporter periplasmic adaptor subunit [Bordetella genomosp. 1]|uniref:Efflux transporter periplasmic adaptor subunit n=1 Tax=Bordetella genomosp. 1 TaxID=1395607 RepID=A0A261RVG6_9BORD|nr:efflux RND transporter periplasmic adaptor subunit [Bordetella genomosp. 1]MDQ8034391.1 efflux RND transporter periplasmic adaptor subunit [Bordetella sp.]OZI28935.1 efflux transporter periplasmic adaptor subunit [Bordetella genomosp. 1]OZI68034.1 efflux transporter periplasmic adaptor subunit [Bordetella genomosp. 1]
MTVSRHRIAVLSIAAALALGAGTYYWSPGKDGAGTAHAQGAPSAPPVDVAPAFSRSIVDWQRYSGRLEAIDRVDIRPLVSGTLTEVHFKDGQLVKKGDALFTIDPRPYVAEVDRAQAALAAARARVSYTASDLSRGQRLITENAIAKRDFEEKQNAAREAAANLQGAQAALETAKLNLGYTRIVAPVDGRVSRAEVTVGNVVNAGAQSVALTTLVSVAEMYASFDVDEQTFLKYVNPARTTGADVPVQLGLANEDAYSREGRVQSIDNRLDTTSGTIRLRAVFDNADGSLLPGLYARVRLGGGAPRDAVLIDEKAVGTDQNKRFVLVVDDQNQATYREVVLGANVGPLRVVEKGLTVGEKIVVNGLQRVRPGEKVAPNLVSMDTAPAAVKTAQASLQ